MFQRWSRLWHGTTKGLTAAAFLIAVASFLSSLLGVLRDRLLAGRFGAGMELDAYYAAFRLPDFLFYLFIVGAFTAGFIPLFTEYAETRGQESAKRFTSQIFAWIGVVMAFLCALIALGAPWIVPIVVHGFSSQAIELTIALTRIMLISPFLMGLSAVMGGVLQSTQRFFAYAFAPVLYNAGIIFGILVLAPLQGVQGVAWGVGLGALLHLLAQWSVVRRSGLIHLTLPRLRVEGVGRLVKLTLPRFLSLAVSQINLLILLGLASVLSVGAVSIFNLANNIQSFPLSIFGISFALAAFPALSKASSLRDHADFSKVLNDTGRKIVFFMLPASAFFVILRIPLVSFILQSGKFAGQDVARTADLVAWFSVSLVAQSFVPLLNRAFFALQNAWKPFWISVIAEGVNLGLAFWLRGFFDITGLVIAFTVASWVNVVLLWVFLRASACHLSSRPFLVSAGKTILATIGLVLASLASERWLWGGNVERTFASSFLRLIVSGLAGSFIFLCVAFVVRLEGVKDLKTLLRKKLSM